MIKGNAGGDGKEAHLSLMRSLSNDNGDVNENDKKTSCNLQESDFLHLDCGW